MKPYLTNSFDWQSERVANVFDEMTLWSANFGQLLLDNFPIKKYEKILGVGFGTGFPLIKIPTSAQKPYCTPRNRRFRF